MTTHSPKADDMDQLLTRFFQAQVPRPWPAAPGALAEPAELSARRNAGDTGARARLTLAASVAILIGSCWYLTNGVQPGDRPSPVRPGGPNLLPDATAKDQDILKGIKEDKAKKGNPPGFTPGPINLP